METSSRKTDRDSFDRIEKIMKMYSGNSDGYIKLAGLALALTLTFAREILHGLRNRETPLRGARETASAHN